MSIRLEIDHSRQESGKEKRQEQLERWTTSETNTCSADRSRHESRLSFQTGAIFLSACQTSDYDEIERILSSDDKKIINYANSDGLTALHQASIDGNIKMIKYLISKGADINVTDNEGWNCLHASASCGYIEIAKYLVESNINITEVTSDGELASDVCAEDAPKMSKFLDEIYKDTDRDFEREKEEKEMFRDSMNYYYYYQTHGVKYRPEPVDDVGASPLHVAAAKGYTLVLRVLLEAGFYIDRKDADGWTPLHASSHWEQFECCKILAAYGANFVTKNNLSQKPVDVVSDDLHDDFKELQKNRLTKDSLPKLPDLPPPSPTNMLMLPDQPQKEKHSPSPPPEIIINTPREEPDSTPFTEHTINRKIPTVDKDAEKEVSLPKKRSKYGVDNEQLSLQDAMARFGEPAKQRVPRAKRIPSTTDSADEDKRKHMSQPVPYQLTNVEQKNKAKKRRESRRSTQGITLDIVSDAKKLIEEKNKARKNIEIQRNFDLADHKLPGGYISKSERDESALGLITKNPKMEQIKLLKELSKRTKFDSQPRKKSPNSSTDGSPMDELGPKIPEIIPKNSSRETLNVNGGVTLNYGDTSARTVHESGDSRLTSQRVTKPMAYPEHLSTIRSPQPPSSPVEKSPSSTPSSRLRIDSESSRKHDGDSEIDYRKLHQEEKLKVEIQKKQNLELSREVMLLKQRVADLELKNRNINEVTEDNSKLKRENAALIRIISKLSK